LLPSHRATRVHDDWRSESGGEVSTFEGNPSLLIIDRYGVWSVTHRRYIRKTHYRRFRDLNKEIPPIIKDYKKLVRRVKKNQWPQYKQDDELRSLRRKLADFYWTVMPEEVKARIVLFYRHRRRQQQQPKLFRCRGSGGGSGRFRAAQSGAHGILQPKG
jgi:hypothetical protein